MSGGRTSSEIAADMLARWIAALPSPAYDIALVAATPSASAVQRRRFSVDELCKAHPFLRWSNGCGAMHVFGRPAAVRHLLLDDLDDQGLASVRRVHRPAAIVETSPGNHQVWITVSARPVALALATASARLLARRFAADPGSADARHCGRLPGFTNRKPRHEDPSRPGHFPWVRLLHARAGVCHAGEALLTEARAELERDHQHARDARAWPDASKGAVASSWAAHARSWREGLLSRLPPTGTLDRSRLDFSVARHLLGDGASPEDVALVLAEEERSRSLPPARRADYIHRTVMAAGRVSLGGRR